MADQTLAEQLGIEAHRVFSTSVPEEVAHSVRLRLLDVLGLCVAAQDLDTSAAILRFVDAQGGVSQASAIGCVSALPASQAALANGVLAHSLDYDDTHLPSVLHPSACVVPAALAAAQVSGASGRQLTSAIALGLEVTVRLGMAGYDEEFGNSIFFEHGQHATSICGAMGGSVAAALLLGLGPVGVKDALGITASMASGVIEANRTGGTVKRLHCGWAAHSAVTAAQLVQAGFTGPPTALEGRFGFFEAFLHRQGDWRLVTEGFGHDWAVPNIFFKPYPANHFTHAVIDAGIQLRELGVDVEQIERVEVGVPSAVIRTIGQPIESKRAPETGYQAQFSGPYAVVVGLLGGKGLGAGLEDFTDELAVATTRRQLMARVDVVADEKCDRIFPQQFPACVTARYRDGQQFRIEVLNNLGGPDRPLTDEQLATKFRDNVRGWIDPDTIATLERGVFGLDNVTDLDALLAPLTQLNVVRA